jgi:hypothetical protein
MSVDFQRTTQSYIPEGRTVHNRSCEDLKSYIPTSCFEAMLSVFAVPANMHSQAIWTGFFRAWMLLNSVHHGGAIFYSSVSWTSHSVPSVLMNSNFLNRDLFLITNFFFISNQKSTFLWANLRLKSPLLLSMARRWGPSPAGGSSYNYEIWFIFHHRYW